MNRFRRGKQEEQIVRRRTASKDGPPRARRRQEPIDVLVQRALAAPYTLQPTDGERLASTLGNRAVGQISARASGNGGADVQAKLRVGAVDDPQEIEAD